VVKLLVVDAGVQRWRCGVADDGGGGRAGEGGGGDGRGSGGRGAAAARGC